MNPVYDTPTFNLKAVVQETGLKPDTLRAWERRYGLPTPNRTAGKHRLYSQRDIDTLKWLIARQDEGLSISRAVDLWQQNLGKGEDPLLTMANQFPTPMAPLETGETLLGLRQSWVMACLNFDELKAEQTLSQAFALYSPETVCVELLQKGLSQIGQQWYRGETTAQQEHFASALAMRRLEALLAMTPPHTRPGRVIIGCPPDEEHTFSPLMLALFLRRRGWDALYLGANVPVSRLEQTISQTQPHLVIMAAQTLPTAATLLEVANLLLRIRVPLGYGGLIFNLSPAARATIPGHFLGEQLEVATKTVERLLFEPTMPAPAGNISYDYARALAHFQARQAHLEAWLWEQLPNGNIPHRYLTAANKHFGNHILAALTLGNIGLLEQALSWVEGFLPNYNHPFKQHALTNYLQTYHQAATQTLGDDGRVVVEWLGRQQADFPITTGN